MPKVVSFRCIFIFQCKGVPSFKYGRSWPIASSQRIWNIKKDTKLYYLDHKLPTWRIIPELGSG